MSAAKMKSTHHAATTATTDAQDRLRKQQQQQQQDDKIAKQQYLLSTTTTSTASQPPTTGTSAAISTVAATASVATTAAARQNHIRKLRSASGDDIKRRSIDKRSTTTTITTINSAKRKRHVNFMPPNKSKTRLTTAKTKTQLPDTTNATVLKSKSILKVKQITVVKHKSGTNKVTKKLKKAPQGAQAEMEAAELSKLERQFTRNPPDARSAEETPIDNDAPAAASNTTTPAPTNSNDNDQLTGKHSLNRRRLLRRKYLTSSGAGIVESGSVNVPPVQRFSPVRDKSAALFAKQNAKVYNGIDSFNIPTTSNNIIVAMVREEHTNKPIKSSNEEALPPPSENEITNNAVASNSNTVQANVADGGVDASDDGTVHTLQELQNPIIAPVVVPIAENTTTSTLSSKNKRRK